MAQGKTTVATIYMKIAIHFLQLFFLLFFHFLFFKNIITKYKSVTVTQSRTINKPAIKLQLSQKCANSLKNGRKLVSSVKFTKDLHKAICFYTIFYHNYIKFKNMKLPSIIKKNKNKKIHHQYVINYKLKKQQFYKQITILPKSVSIDCYYHYNDLFQ